MYSILLEFSGFPIQLEFSGDLFTPSTYALPHILIKIHYADFIDIFKFYI